MRDPISLANSAREATDFEQAVLEGLQRDVGFDAAFFASFGERPTTVALDPSKLARAFGDPTYERELVPLKKAASAARGVVVDTRLLGESEVRRRAYHRDFASTAGGRHTLFAWPFLRGQPVGALMLGRKGSSFTDAEIRAVESLLPGIGVGRASFRLPWRGAPLPGGECSFSARASARCERTLARAETRDGAVLVRDKDGYREMVAIRGETELVWSRADVREPSRSGWFYINLFHLAAARARFRRRALFVGCGGAVGVRQFAEVYPGIAIDLVDIDANVVSLAVEWYGLAAIPGVSVHLAEGTAFMKRAPPGQWDVVVIDAYDADLATGFASRAFFAEVRRVLRAGGQMAFNVIGTLGGRSAVQIVERSARAELSDVRLVPVVDPRETYSPDAERNVVVLGGRA